VLRKAHARFLGLGTGNRAQLPDHYANEVARAGS